MIIKQEKKGNEMGKQEKNKVSNTTSAQLRTLAAFPPWGIRRSSTKCAHRRANITNFYKERYYNLFFWGNNLCFLPKILNKSLHFISKCRIL